MPVKQHLAGRYAQQEVIQKAFSTSLVVYPNFQKDWFYPLIGLNYFPK